MPSALKAVNSRRAEQWCLPPEQAEKIVLVQDNLNTRTPTWLYEAFEPDEPLNR
jgi:hypothetical protein